MPNDLEGMGRLLARKTLPARFERWRLRLPAGASRLTSAEEWAGALVLVERGCLAAECTVGGTRTFCEGDLLALGWLPLRRLVSVGEDDLELLAVRRRDVDTTEPYLHVVRAPAATTMRRGPKPSRRALP
jgi:hypothetical protein